MDFTCKYDGKKLLNFWHNLPIKLVPKVLVCWTVYGLASLFYSGLNLNQDKATKPQTVQIVRQGEATPYWFKVNPL